MMRVLRNPVTTQKAADAYQKSVEMQDKFLNAQRANNNRITHDRWVAAGMIPPSIMASNIHDITKQ